MNEEKMHVPLTTRIRGDFTLEVIDTRTGKTRETRNQRNMLLDGLLDRWFSTAIGNNTSLKRQGRTSTSDMFESTGNVQTRCYLGSGDTAVQRSDTDLATRQADRGVTSANTEFSDGTDHPAWCSMFFRFPAGTYVGTVREVGLGFGSFGNAPFRLYARQLVSPELPLTENDELRVTWKITYDLGTRVSAGTLENAQRDGTTNVAWRSTVNDAQLWRLIAVVPRGRLFDPGSASHIRLRMGTSNAESVLASDGNAELKGTQLYFGTANSSLSSVSSYASGDYFRDLTLGFEHDAPNNVSIGEMILEQTTSDGEGAGGIMRVTFDPPLDKAELFRLFITMRFTLDPN